MLLHNGKQGKGEEPWAASGQSLTEQGASSDVGPAASPTPSITSPLAAVIQWPDDFISATHPQIKG